MTRSPSTRSSRRLALSGALGLAVLAATGALAQTPAKQLFGAAVDAAPMTPAPYGSYAKGCVAGAEKLEEDGPTWQAMRLSRNRNWGHPELVDFLRDLAADAPSVGWNGLLVGDLSQPRGGPMLTGHASHQIGLDADIWLTEMPERRLSDREREEISAVSMLKDGTRTLDAEKFTRDHASIIKRAASDERVARIFVHPAIKEGLCRMAPQLGRGETDWLRRVRPWYGHHYHFHVRLNCPAGASQCKNQDPPPAGTGCGGALAYWLSDEPWTPKPGAAPAKPKPPLTLAGLPNACRTVLTAGGAPIRVAVPLPRGRGD